MFKLSPYFLCGDVLIGNFEDTFKIWLLYKFLPKAFKLLNSLTTIVFYKFNKNTVLTFITVNYYIGVVNFNVWWSGKLKPQYKLVFTNLFGLSSLKNL